MDPADVMVIGRNLMLTALLVAAPAVATSLLVGLLVSVLQTLTSIQEQTLSFVPRIVAVSVAMLIALPWMLKLVMSFTVQMMTQALELGN